MYSFIKNSLLCSLVLLASLSNAIAGDTNNAVETNTKSSHFSQFVDHFHLGGYSSGGITLPERGTAQAGVNEISLLLTWENEGPISFFSELELENPISWNRHQEFDSQDRYFDLERFYFDYSYSDKVNVRTGRFLTPTGRWNLLHAPPLVWTTTRPLATSQLFPTATNGVMAYGASAFDENIFEYNLFAEVLKDQDEDDDEPQFKNVRGAHLGYGKTSNGKTTNIGLNLLSFTEKKLPQFTNNRQFIGNNGSASYRMLGIDFIHEYKDVEFLAEAYQRWDANNKNGGSGGYIQTAVPIPHANNWVAIIRAETLHRPDEGHDSRWVLGATWHIKPTQLLKLEFTGGSADFPESPRGFLGSFAVLF